MVFPSPPLFLDPPNWNHQHQGGELHQIQISQQPPPQQQLPPCPDGGSRPSSMSDRARLAKLPQPEAALKCPRCDSANTKFCYFNNYSLTQPRHFCKTCRRYWTRGGALRNVPVGGGSRRNKRSKSGGGGGGPKSQSAATSSSSSAAANNNINMINIPQMHAPQMAPPFMTSLYHAMPEVGMSFPDIQQAAGEEEQWRRIQQIQQFPFLGGLEAPPMGPAPVSGSYSFDGEGGGIVTQMASVKMEDRHPGLNLQRQFLGIPRNDQYWGGGNGNNGGGGGSSGGGGGGGGWMMDLSCFNASSSGNPL